MRRRNRPLDGDRRAWLTELYAAEADVVFRYAASRCGRDAATEIVAETFVEAVASSGRYDPGRGSTRAWLLGIATNRIRRRRHAETAYLTADRGAADDRLDDLPDRVDAERMGPLVRRELAALPAGERAAFLLHAVADLSPAEVAAALDIAPGAARVRLHRARTRLQHTLALEASR